MTIQMKDICQNFHVHVALLIMLYKVVVTFKSVYYAVQGGSNIKPKLCVTIQMKAIERYFHVVLFIMLYKMVLTLKSADKTLVCDH